METQLLIKTSRFVMRLRFHLRISNGNKVFQCFHLRFSNGNNAKHHVTDLIHSYVARSDLPNMSEHEVLDPVG